MSRAASEGLHRLSASNNHHASTDKGFRWKKYWERIGIDPSPQYNYPEKKNPFRTPPGLYRAWGLKNYICTLNLNPKNGLSELLPHCTASRTAVLPGPAHRLSLAAAMWWPRHSIDVFSPSPESVPPVPAPAGCNFSRKGRNKKKHAQKSVRQRECREHALIMNI